MTQMHATAAQSTALNLTLSRPAPRGPFLVRFVAAYAEYRSIKTLSTAQLADVGMSKADRDAVTLNDVFAKARG